MNFRQWIQSDGNFDRAFLDLEDAWNAGASAMFDALVQRGYLASDAVSAAVRGTGDVATLHSTRTLNREPSMAASARAKLDFLA
jgi:hypothetical protein